MKNYLLFLSWLLVSVSTSFSQYTQQDSLRGSITPERAWWDVKHYDITIDVDPDKKWISGFNQITFTPIAKGDVMQVDLQAPMKITAIRLGKKKCEWTSKGSAHFIKVPCKLKVGQSYNLKISYEGSPIRSKNPPWDGGLIWRKNNNNHFIATACQGAGASLWWPCKDHPSDETEGAKISITVPNPLVAVSNGKLIKKKENDHKNTYTWKVVNPINNYGINMNIATYEHFADTYSGLNGPLSLDYYVLPENLKKAQIHFKEVSKMLKAFEYWFGPYPFYEDGYKLVETPYLGMEHQSSVTYGNKYQYGYLGRDLSKTGMGLLFDFIIIHESAHEWYANNITAADNADMWIHESFTHYAESLFLEYYHGKDTASQYILGVRSSIKNDRPIQGPYNVNKSGSGDMYYKGANVIHTLRQVINDDQLWREMLRGMNSQFRHQTILANDLITFLEKKSGINLQSFFHQYFQSTLIPIFEYRIFPGGMTYRWSQTVPNFNMPIDVYLDSVKTRLTPTSKWKTIDRPHLKNVAIDKNYYVSTFNLTN